MGMGREWRADREKREGKGRVEGPSFNGS